jgi:hypothetical protein
MSLTSFLEALWEDGRVKVAPPGDVAPDDRAEAERRLVELERIAAADLPGEPPSYDGAAAIWGAEMLYRACQFAVFRDLGRENIAAAFAEPCPGQATAAQHYSVDLTFQFLPDLHRLTRQAAPADPLVAKVAEWAALWPLSSVGIAEISPARAALDIVVAQPALRRLYVDRIIARADASRLTDERVREAVCTALGLHLDLAGDLAKHLRDAAAPGK